MAAALLVLGQGPGDGIDAEPSDTGFFVSGSDAVGPTGSSSSSPTSAGGSQITAVEVPMCLGGDQTCAAPVLCEDGTPMVQTWYESDGVVVGTDDNCPDEPGVAPEPEVTPGLVAAAFQRIPLPEAELVVQPPGGRTLVNFDTNFYTERDELTRTVTLLGRRVELRIWPASFGWRFGDGETRQTTSPGAAYPDLEITHRYLEKGRVSPSVDTTYAAQFRVGGGPWRDVQGTVTIPGTPEGLRVVTARPVLVGAASY